MWGKMNKTVQIQCSFNSFLESSAWTHPTTLLTQGARSSLCHVKVNAPTTCLLHYWSLTARRDSVQRFLQPAREPHKPHDALQLVSISEVSMMYQILFCATFIMCVFYKARIFGKIVVLRLKLLSLYCIVFQQ